MPSLLVIAEFGFSETGEREFLPLLDRVLDEVRAIDGCLEAVVWTRPERRYSFFTVWHDRDAVERWVANPFHRETLMPGFRRWCTEGWFGYWDRAEDHNRARRCPSCGRWTQAQPGWSELAAPACRHCGTALDERVALSGRIRRAFDEGTAVT